MDDPMYDPTTNMPKYQRKVAYVIATACVIVGMSPFIGITAYVSFSGQDRGLLNLQDASCHEVVESRERCANVTTDQDSGFCDAVEKQYQDQCQTDK